MLFLSFLENLLGDAYNIFQKDVDNFEIEHKTLGVRGVAPPWPNPAEHICTTVTRAQNKM